MKKRLVLFLAILAIAAVCVYAQSRKRQQGVTIAPGEVITFSTSGEMVKVEPAYYWYKPRPDITTYELALLLPLFSGPSYGLGEWSSREAAIVPERDRHHGGWPVNGSILRIDEWKAKDLGTAMRHFVKLPLGDK